MVLTVITTLKLKMELSLGLVKCHPVLLSGTVGPDKVIRLALRLVPE